jgi:phosphoribosylanthranilate isomerase
MNKKTTKIKICGITNIEDALIAASLGANALGFVFADSPRKVSPDLAADIIAKLHPFITTVGVFVNRPIGDVKSIADYCNLDVLQFHGDEDVLYCRSFRQKVIKAFRMRSYTEIEDWMAQEANIGKSEFIDDGYDVKAYLVDAYSGDRYGGTGVSLNWDMVRRLKTDKSLILAGGLDHKNVATAIKTVKPDCVDVSSGVEQKPGKKSKQKMRAFVEAVREANG